MSQMCDFKLLIGISDPVNYVRMQWVIAGCKHGSERPGSFNSIRHHAPLRTHIGPSVSWMDVNELAPFHAHFDTYRVHLSIVSVCVGGG